MISTAMTVDGVIDVGDWSSLTASTTLPRASSS
jgi:hypothetical protein